MSLLYLDTCCIIYLIEAAHAGASPRIVPLPPDAVARRRARHGELYRSNDYSGTRWRYKDLPALGWRHPRHYDMRATFITLAIEDGADPDVIETRVTHSRRADWPGTVCSPEARVDGWAPSMPVTFTLRAA